MRMIRPEQPADAAAVRAVHEHAFGRPAEADLVERLRAHCSDFISLVMEADRQVIGHLLFTPVELATADGRSLTGLGLAPVAVLPTHQNQGLGTVLIETGLLEVQSAGWPYVVVLGHPDYYPRFGFVPALSTGVRCEYAVPPEAFLLLAFEDAALRGLEGTVRYRPEFAEL